MAMEVVPQLEQGLRITSEVVVTLSNVNIASNRMMAFSACDSQVIHRMSPFSELLQPS